MFLRSPEKNLLTFGNVTTQIKGIDVDYQNYNSHLFCQTPF